MQWLAYAPWSTALSMGLRYQLMRAAETSSYTAKVKGSGKTGQGQNSGSSSPAAPASLDATGTAVPNSAPGSLSSASLAGRVVYTSGGHGYVWRDGSSSWGVMRSYLNNMMEDLGNQDQLEPFANYLLNAGATVVSMRPVGHQTNEVIVDNATTYSAATGGYQKISGTWTNMTDGPYWSNSSTGNDSVHYVTAATSATETAVVRFTPKIPEAGFYPVYAWYNPGSNSSSNDRVADQTFRINYAGGSREVKVAANKTGKGWVYLGDYYFESGVNGVSGSVEVSNKSATTGKKVVADAIRFGNGMGDVNYSYSYSGGNAVLKTFPVSGQPREDECALYWCYAMRGWTSPNTPVAPSVVYSGSSTDDETKNFSACDAYAAYMNQGSVGSNRDRVWISFHSNAGGGRGTVGLITGSATTNQEELALIAGRTVQNVMQGLNASHEFNWSMNSTPTYTGAYGEISTGYIGSEFDATIIEVAYHDNATDAALLKDPAVRNDVGKAAYQAAVQYFKAFGSLTNTNYLPEPPADVRATTDASGNVTVSWNAGPSSPVMAAYDPLGTDNVNSTTDNPGPYGNPATSYKVYTSVNGRGFDGGVTVTGTTSLTFTSLSTTTPTYFRVTSVNAGGESMGSYVVVAKPQASGRAPLLIVNGFTRVDDNGDQIDTKYFGTVARARYRYNNTFDYVTQIAPSVVNYDAVLGMESTSASAIAAGLINLADYQAVIWLTGEQATSRFTTFDSTTQAMVTSYLNGGGKLFVSGANVAYNLTSSGDNKGNAFLSSTLHATYVRDDANTYNFAAGVSGSAFANVPAGSFDNGTHGSYDVDNPDGISPANGATAALTYSGGAGGTAAVQYSSGQTRLILMAFPVESVYAQSTRDALIAGALDFFGVAVAPPTPSPTPGTPDLADASDLGPSKTDNVTNRNNATGRTLQFTVPGTVAGALVELFVGTTLIGQATAASGSTLVTTNGVVTLPNGTYQITAVQTAPDQLPSAASNALAVTIDTAAPSALFDLVPEVRNTALPSIRVNFSEPVYGFSPSDLTLSRDGEAIPMGPGLTDTVDGNSRVVGNLATVTSEAGYYTLSMVGISSGITDLAGNPLLNNTSVSWLLNTINGTTGDDTILLARDASDPSVLHVTVNGGTPYALHAAGNGDISISSGDGNDSIILDFSAGDPQLDGSLSISTGPANSGDSIALIGTPGDDTIILTDSTMVLNAGPTVYYSTESTTPVSVSFQGSTGHDSLSIFNRSAMFPSDVSLTTSNLTLNLGAGASATFASMQHLAGLHLSDNAAATLTSGGNKVLVASSLSITGAAKLDLSDNDLIVESGLTGDQLRQYLQAGRLFSSSAVADVDQVTGLGYAFAGELGVGTFAGQGIGTGALLVKYTYLGDTDLNGRVTADDLARVDRGRAKGLGSWLWGDANYDGVVDAIDVAIAHTAFAKQGTVL